METLVSEIAEKMRIQQLILATAESCTGGWISEALTSIAGSSDWFDCGVVTYSNEAKQSLLGVSKESLQQFGAVSEQVVSEMAEGVIRCSRADLSVATSGIAGPGGGSVEKPVGTVCFAWAERDKGSYTETKIFLGDREAVRKQAVKYALEGILNKLSL